MWTDGQTDMTKPIDAFRNYASAPKNEIFYLIPVTNAMVAEPVISTPLIEKPAVGYDPHLLYRRSSPTLTTHVSRVSFPIQLSVLSRRNQRRLPNRFPRNLAVFALW